MTTAWPEPLTAPLRDLTSAPGCPYCDTIQAPLIGPLRTIEALPLPFIPGVDMLWAVDPEVASTPDTHTCRVRECLDCGRSWNEAAG